MNRITGKRVYRRIEAQAIAPADYFIAKISVNSFRMWLAKCLFVIISVVATAAYGDSISVIDDSGYEIVLDSPAQRIITLAPHLTEQVYSAGGGNRIVATVNYSNYPLAAKEHLRIGSYKQISFEMVVGLNPDLILAFGGNGWEMINRLRDLGYTVYVDEPREMEDVASALTRFGTLLGTEAHTAPIIQRFKARLTALQQQFSEQQTLRVFYQVWNEPLITINGEHLISSVMRLCGGRNIFSDAIPMAPRVSVETVAYRDPHAIIASGHGEQKPEWLDNWKLWPAITAVKNDHLFFIPPDILQRHTVRILDGAQMMCEFLHEARRSNK